MTYRSILFEKAENHQRRETPEAPACFVDLNLDQIVEAITVGKAEYDLKPFFYTPLRDIDTIRYRHEVMQDLENSVLYEHIKAFAQTMRAMRDHLTQANKLYYPLQKERWFLEVVEIYCDAINDLVQNLAAVDLQSRGLRAFRDYVTQYAASERFTALLTETQHLKAELSSITYCLLIKDNSVTVCLYESETDYSAEVVETFTKFKQGTVKDYRVKYRTGLEMNHVEARILDFVARLYPDTFAKLNNYCVNHRDYLDQTISAFDREIQFYVAYLEFIARLRRAGLTFCYPQISNQDKEIFSYDSFDLALANKLIGEQSAVVCNDFYLKGRERIFVVSGPNQGGKTTFARTFGQLHYLASIGCPVPGRAARLYLFDQLLTHFEKEEDISNLRGKLEDEVVRIHAILNHATPDSIVIMNEIFTSTTLNDAIILGEKVMEQLLALDVLGVCVTFIDEWASLSEKTVSMVSTIVPENPALRTFKIVRRPPDGLAYAVAIAEKYGLTYDCLKERIKS
jgi:DNA mismatch repair ATPase MutS